MRYLLATKSKLSQRTQGLIAIGAVIILPGSFDCQQNDTLQISRADVT